MTTPEVGAPALALHRPHLDAAARTSGRSVVARRGEGEQILPLPLGQALDHHQQHAAVDERDPVGLGNHLGLIKRTRLPM